MVVCADKARVDVEGAPEAFVVQDGEMGLESVLYFFFGVECNRDAVRLAVANGGKHSFARCHVSSPAIGDAQLSKDSV
jgi:hypothetical protein